MTVSAIIIEQLIDDGAISRRQTQIFLICCLLAMVDGFDLQVMAMVLPELSADWEIEPALFGWALSAGVFGGMVGGFGMGFIGGAVEPRRIIIAATATVSVFTGCCAFATSATDLMILRFLTGLGLGATIPALIAIVSAFTPYRKRSIAVTVTSASQMLGGMVGGALITPIVPAYGWQSAFLLGAILPAILLYFVVRYLPNPPSWTLRERQGADKIAGLLKSFGMVLPIDAPTTNNRPDRTAGGTIRDLLRPSLLLGTIGLWITCVSGAMFFYLLINWLPTLLSSGGGGASTTIGGSIVLNAGGFCGAIAMSLLMDRGRPYATIIVGYAVAACLALSSILLFNYSTALNLATIFMIGVFGVGSYFCITSLHVHYFPVKLAGTAIGCAVGFSRAGAIVAPLLGSLVLSLGGHMTEVFVVAAGFAAISAVATILVAWSKRRAASTS